MALLFFLAGAFTVLLTSSRTHFNSVLTIQSFNPLPQINLFNWRSSQSRTECIDARLNKQILQVCHTPMPFRAIFWTICSVEYQSYKPIKRKRLDHRYLENDKIQQNYYQRAYHYYQHIHISSIPSGGRAYVILATPKRRLKR